MIIEIRRRKDIDGSLKTLPEIIQEASELVSSFMTKNENVQLTMDSVEKTVNKYIITYKESTIPDVEGRKKNVKEIHPDRRKKQRKHSDYTIDDWKLPSSL